MFQGNSWNLNDDQQMPQMDLIKYYNLHHLCLDFRD